MQTLEYNKQTHKITLCSYTDDEFLESEVDITEQVTTLVLEKLYDDYNMDEGDELLVTKKKSLSEHTKINITNKKNK